MDSILPYAVCALLYAAVTTWRWRVTVQGSQAVEQRTGLLERHAAIVPLALHTMLLVRDMFAGGNLYLGIGTAVSLILWVTMVIYWAGGGGSRPARADRADGRA